MVVILRGGFQDRPLNFSHSNFSPYRFTNLLSINPLWNLAYTYKSFLEEKTYDRFENILISLEKSKIISRQSIKEVDTEYLNDDYPLLRNSNYGKDETNYNVIIILMESFAGQYIGALGHNGNISPEFDKLSKEGVLFTRMFSGGTRTNRGLSNTLLSFPSLPRYKSIINDSAVDQDFGTIGTILKQRAYNTNFIFSGDPNFDNMKGFFRSHGFDKFYGDEMFSNETFSTSWGVSDEAIFNKSLDILKKESEPFLSVILTISNHPPYLYPEDPSFISVDTDGKMESRLNAFKYSDWALGKFISDIKKLSFYDRTILFANSKRKKNIYHA